MSLRARAFSFVALAALAHGGIACSPAESAPVEEADAGGDEAPAALPDAAPALRGTGGTGGLACLRREDLGVGRTSCVAKIGSVEVKVLEPLASKVSAGPLRLGLYLHGDGAAAHKSGSALKALVPWADAQGGLVVSALAPNGCAWWLSPAHDCSGSLPDLDLAAENGAALDAALDAIMKAYDVRTDGMRYYASSGGSIFVTEEWIPLNGGKYPGVFALMCGGAITSRSFGWDPGGALRDRDPLWFTYGDQDYLVAAIRASIAAFRDKGFAVTERVVPNAGHCAFDAHAEALAIWSANP